MPRAWLAELIALEPPVAIDQVLHQVGALAEGGVLARIVAPGTMPVAGPRCRERIYPESMRIPTGLAPLAVLGFGSCTAPFESATPTPHRPTVSSDANLTARGTGDVVTGSRMKLFEDNSFATALQFATRLPGGKGGDSEGRGEGVQP